MMMVVLVRVLLIVTVSVMLAGAAWSEPVILKFNCFEPPQSFVLTKVFMPWVEKVNKEGEGFLKIEVYPGGVLCRSPLKQLKTIRDGVADIAWILPSYTPGVFEDDEVVEVPFMAENALEASLALWRMLQKGMLRGYDTVHPLFLAAGQQYGIHSTFPVQRPMDLKGKKIRAVGKMQHYFAEAYGATPVGRLPVVKIAEAISRGLIKATLNEWNAVRTFRIEDVAAYHCLVPLGTISFLVAINKQKYESLSPKAKGVLDKYSGEPFVRSWGEKMDQSLAKYQEKMSTDPKHHVFIPSGSGMDEWEATLRPAVEAWTKDHPKSSELIKAYKEDIAKVRAGN